MAIATAFGAALNAVQLEDVVDAGAAWGGSGAGLLEALKGATEVGQGAGRACGRGPA